MIDQTDKEVAFRILDERRDNGEHPMEVMMAIREEMGLSRSEAGKIFAEWARANK